MRNFIKPNYTKSEIENYTRELIAAEHYRLQQVENGEHLFQTFGEWAAAHPNHYLAKRNYPKDEYIQVISTFKKYFDQKAKELVEIDI